MFFQNLSYTVEKATGYAEQITRLTLLPVHIVLWSQLADRRNNCVKPPDSISLDSSNLVLERAQHFQVCKTVRLQTACVSEPIRSQVGEGGCSKR